MIVPSFEIVRDPELRLRPTRCVGVRLRHPWIHLARAHLGSAGIVILTGLVLMGLALPAPVSAQSGDGPDTVSVLDGVYSEEQAREGRQVFDMECGLCHAPGEFSGTTFQLSWTSRPVGALYSHIQMTMPQDRPGSLTAAQYAAVVAYILELNGYPTGEEPLPTNLDSLRVIQLERNPNDGR